VTDSSKVTWIGVKTENGMVSFSVPEDRKERQRIIDQILPYLPEGQWTETEGRPGRRRYDDKRVAAPPKKEGPKRKHGKYRGSGK
jgi:hypothetical protein